MKITLRYLLPGLVKMEVNDNFKELDNLDALDIASELLEDFTDNEILEGLAMLQNGVKIVANRQVFLHDGDIKVHAVEADGEDFAATKTWKQFAYGTEPDPRGACTVKRSTTNTLIDGHKKMYAELYEAFENMETQLSADYQTMQKQDEIIKNLQIELDASNELLTKYSNNIDALVLYSHITDGVAKIERLFEGKKEFVRELKIPDNIEHRMDRINYILQHINFNGPIKIVEW